MAENENAPVDANQAAQAPAKASAKGKLLAAGIVSFVIVVETVVAYVIFPPAPDTAALADARLGDTAGVHTEIEGEQAQQNPMIEVELGSFSVSAFQPASNTTLRVDFSLYGLAKEEDQDELTSKLAQLSHRFREQVIITVRGTEITDLSDPGLGLIKRKILEKSNHAFGKSFLQEIIIDEFSFVEQ